MKNKLFILAALVFGLAGCAQKEKESKSEVVIPPMPVNDLPAMSVTLLEGTRFNTRDLKGKNILILFQPDCDHCQHEAVQIRENLALFKNYKLYFLSSASPQEIQKFADDYKLKGNAEVLFGMTSFDDVINNFGPIQAPSVYIYVDQKRIQEFNGQVDVSVIAKYL